jgi:hypothetical protein
MSENSENIESTLIFVDMLGFAAQTERCPTQTVSGPGWSETSETSNKFGTFQRVLDKCIFDQGLNGSLQAMLFSDCAFLNLGNSLRVSKVAIDLMRQFILAKVAVRMGIGQGTFYLRQCSNEFSDTTAIARALFFGTAVVRAHHAERGGKGLRIFVHPSVELDESCVKVLPLASSSTYANRELNFLYEPMPVNRHPPVSYYDCKLFDEVYNMKDLAPVEEHIQYTETTDAINRMRKQYGREALGLKASSPQ